MSDRRSRAAGTAIERAPAGGLTLADRIPLLEAERTAALLRLATLKIKRRKLPKGSRTKISNCE